MLAKYLRIAGAIALFLLSAIIVFSQTSQTATPPPAAAAAPVPPPTLSREEMLELANIELQMQILQMKYNEKIGQLNAAHPGFFFNGQTHQFQPIPNKAPEAQKAK